MSDEPNSAAQHSHRAAHGHLATVPRSAETLDEVVTTTTIKAWIAVLAVAVVLIGVVFWSFMATGPQRVQDLGVVTESSPKTVIAYVSFARAQVYRPESEVTIKVADLNTGDREEYQAEVTQVANNPATDEQIEKSVNSEGVAERMLREAGQVAYRVDLTIQDRETVTTSGMVVEIVNTYANPKPIELLFGGADD